MIVFHFKDLGTDMGADFATDTGILVDNGHTWHGDLFSFLEYFLLSIRQSTDELQWILS